MDEVKPKEIDNEWKRNCKDIGGEGIGRQYIFSFLPYMEYLKEYL